MKFILSLFLSVLAILASERGALDLTSMAPALKVYYTNQKVEDLNYRDHTFLALLPKMEDFYGKNLPIPIHYARPQGRSATFATAKANQTSSKFKDFTLTRAHDYSLATVDNETLEATKNDKGAFMQALTVETDGAMGTLARSLAVSVHRSGSGSIGRVSTSSFAVQTCTLTDANDIVNFEVGMKIVVSDADGGGSVRSGTLLIDGVDRDAGTFHTTANLSTGIAAIAQNDYIFSEGDYDQKIKGLMAWIPLSAPAATLFFGVDRTADIVRLAGVRKDLRGMPLEEAWVKLLVAVCREGGRPDYGMCSHEAFRDLEISLGSKVQYVDVKAGSEGQIGFQGIRISSPKGSITIVADMDCPNDRIYVLTLSSWKLYSLGKAPRIFNADGTDVLRDPDADALTLRCLYYAQLGCTAPGWNGVGQIR